MTINYFFAIARWDDDGGAPIGRFEFAAGDKAKVGPKPAKPIPAPAS
jgi:hypothetical protein